MTLPILKAKSFELCYANTGNVEKSKPPTKSSEFVIQVLKYNLQ